MMYVPSSAHALKKGFPLSLLFGLALVWLGACKLEHERLEPNPGKGLRFSVDTVDFDTVFTEMQTVTLRLRVYNENDRAVNLRSVYVKNRLGNTPYSFAINGRVAPTRIQNIGLEGKDSAYVLISAKLDGRNQNNPFILEDSLVFEVEGRSRPQFVRIRAYGQDALYLRNFSIKENTTWKADRPIILMDSVSIASNRILTIEPGTRIYGYNFSYLVVRGSLVIQGTKDKPVIFQGTRLENYYQNVPGQWVGILIMDGGSADVVHATVKNSIRGFQVGEVGPFSNEIPRPGQLILRNSKIENVVDYGILGLKGLVLAINNHIVDCGEGGFAGLQGGRYELWHNTFGMSGNNPFRREELFQWTFADNFLDQRNNTRYLNELSVKAVNNLVNGSETEEIGIGEKKGPDPLQLVFMHNLLRSKTDAYFDKTEGPFKGNQRLPSDFRFIQPLRYNFMPDTNSRVKIEQDMGLPLDTVTSSLRLDDEVLRNFLSSDINGNLRKVEPGAKPDVGAYNRFTK